MTEAIPFGMAVSATMTKYKNDSLGATHDCSLTAFCQQSSDSLETFCFAEEANQYFQGNNSYFNNDKINNKNS